MQVKKINFARKEALLTATIREFFIHNILIIKESKVFVCVNRSEIHDLRQKVIVFFSFYTTQQENITSEEVVKELRRINFKIQNFIAGRLKNKFRYIPIIDMQFEDLYSDFSQLKKVLDV